MGDNYVTMTIRRNGKVVLIVTCDEDTKDEGFLFDIIDSYAIPECEIKIKTEEVKLSHESIP